MRTTEKTATSSQGFPGLCRHQPILAVSGTRKVRPTRRDCCDLNCQGQVRVRLKCISGSTLPVVDKLSTPSTTSGPAHSHVKLQWKFIAQ